MTAGQHLTALLYASDNDNDLVEIATGLLNAGADTEIRINSLGFTPLMIAVSRVDTKVIWSLLDRGAAVNAIVDRSRVTAVYNAPTNGGTDDNSTICELLSHMETNVGIQVSKMISKAPQIQVTPSARREPLGSYDLLVNQGANHGQLSLSENRSQEWLHKLSIIKAVTNVEKNDQDAFGNVDQTPSLNSDGVKFLGNVSKHFG